MTKKVRFIPVDVCGLSVREAGEGQERIVDGTPIVFGVRSVNLTPWRDDRVVYEVLEPGCITQELLQRSDVVLNLNHSMMVTDILGRHRGREKDTLKLTLTPSNVKSSCVMPNTNSAHDAEELIKREDITGMSFAFEDDYQDTENGVSYERTEERTDDGKEVWIRHVKRITGLYDVSIVTHPAYEQTSVASREQGDEMMRIIDEQIEAAKQREQPNGSEDVEHRDAEPAQQAEEQSAEETNERAADIPEETSDGNSGDNQEDGETDEQKAEREKREAEEAQRQQEELEEEEAAQRFREQRAMRMRFKARRLNDEILDSISN